MKYFVLFFKRFRFLFFTGSLILLILQGCIKDKYDFNKLSPLVQITPEVVFPVIHGSMMMGNMVKPNDTVVFENNGAVKVVFRKDSIFRLGAAQILQIKDQAPGSSDIALGPFRLDDFSAATDIATSNGTAYPLPPFTNFTHVTFWTGDVSVTVTNHYASKITTLTLLFRNTGDNSPIGSDPVVFSNIPSDGSETQTMSLSGVAATNEWSVEVVSGSPVFTTNDLNVSLVSSGVKALSGNAILPDQVFYADTDNFNLDLDTLQLTYLAFRKGVMAYTVSSPFSEEIDFDMVFPTGSKHSDTLKYSFPVVNGSNDDSLRLDSASFDLSTDATQPYNILPYRYQVSLKSSGNLVDFNGADQFHFTYQLRNLYFQYVQGYFGKRDFVFEKDTLDVGLDDFFRDIRGTVSLTNPQVHLLYSNGFGIAAEVKVNVKGETNAGEQQLLNASPMTLVSPQDRTDPPAEGELDFTKENTDIVSLIDLHPSYIVYGGKAVINPEGNQGWTNFVSAHSNLLLDLEVEVPLEFRMQDLVLQDTVENPFHSDPADSSDFTLKNLDYAKINLQAENGFPVGINFKILLYDSTAHVIVDSILFHDIVNAASVDANGRVTQSASSNQWIEIGRMQLDELENTDQLIVAGIFNTTDQGTKSVKIYTDYTFDFKLAFQTKIHYDFNLNDAGN